MTPAEPQRCERKGVEVIQCIWRKIETDECMKVEPRRGCKELRQQAKE